VLFRLLLISFPWLFLFSFLDPIATFAGINNEDIDGFDFDFSVNFGDSETRIYWMVTDDTTTGITAAHVIAGTGVLTVGNEGNLIAGGAGCSGTFESAAADTLSQNAEVTW
jgi:hypothetical protein